MCGNFVTAIAALDKGSAIIAPLLNVESGLKLAPEVSRLLTTSVNNAPVRRRMTLTSLLIDIGHQCSASVEIFKRLLYFIKINEQTIDEVQIAEIIVAILPQTPRIRVNAPPNGGVKPEHFHVYQHIKETDADLIKMDLTKEWQLDNVVEVLKQFCMARQAYAAAGATLSLSTGAVINIQPIQWNSVVRHLDQPLLRIKSEAEFQIIIKILLRLTNGKPISAEGLIRGIWSNKAAQIALLMLSTNVSRNFVDFSSLVTPDQIISDASNTIQQPQNFSWMAIPVYQTLMELAANGMSGQVLEVLSVAASIYPEYVTIGLAQVQDPSSGVRTEILRRTLPLFTGVVTTITTTTPATATSPAVTQTTTTRPTSAIVMKRLYEVNNIDLLILLCRFSLKKVTSAAELNDIDTRFRSFPNNIIRKRIEEESSVDELLAYWCLLADKNELGSTLEEKLKINLEKHPTLIKQFYLFCAANVK